MQGQANHFYRCKYLWPIRHTAKLNRIISDAPTKIDYAINRYQTETKRLYQVLNDRLAAQRAQHNIPANTSAYLVGNKYSIADLCSFSWVNWAEWAGVPTKSFPEVQLWLETIQKRPAVERGVNVPDKFEMKEAMKTKEGEEEYAKHHSNWVMKGQEEEQGRHK